MGIIGELIQTRVLSSCQGHLGCRRRRRRSQTVRVVAVFVPCLTWIHVSVMAAPTEWTAVPYNAELRLGRESRSIGGPWPRTIGYHSQKEGGPVQVARDGGTKRSGSPQDATAHFKEQKEYERQAYSR